MRVIDADALMEAINTWPKFGVDGCGRIVPWNEGYEPYIHLRDAVIAISALRQPERKKGKWKAQIDEDRSLIWWKCSECGHIIFSESERDRRDFHAFCGRCGADMRDDS